MSAKKNIRFEDWEAERMKDPEFRAAVEESEPIYQETRLRIARSLQKEKGDKMPTQETERTKVTPVLYGLLLAAITFLLLALCSGPEPAAKATATPDVGHPLEACGWCQVEVKGELKAPASAKFPSCNRAGIREVSEGVYEVKSYVDAQNSFGAMIRTGYVCQVRYRGDHLWTLQSLAFGE